MGQLTRNEAGHNRDNCHRRGPGILVNNAAVFFVGPVEEFGLAEFDRMIAMNVRAPFVASRAAAGHLGDGGRIITIGSNMVQR